MTLPIYYGSNSVLAAGIPGIPTFEAVGTLATGGDAISPPLPSGLNPNDLMILVIETSNQAITIADANGGTWTEVADSPQSLASPASRLTVFYSRYNGTQGDPTTSDSGNHQVGQIAAFRGVVRSNDPWNVTSGNTDNVEDDSLSATGDTTTVANCMIVICVGLDSNAEDFGATWTNSDLANVTERINDSTSFGNDGRIGLVTGELAIAGTYGATTNTLTATAGSKEMMTIALRP